MCLGVTLVGSRAQVAPSARSEQALVLFHQSELLPGVGREGYSADCRQSSTRLLGHLRFAGCGHCLFSASAEADLVVVAAASAAVRISHYGRGWYLLRYCLLAVGIGVLLLFR